MYYNSYNYYITQSDVLSPYYEQKLHIRGEILQTSVTDSFAIMKNKKMYSTCAWY